MPLPQGSAIRETPWEMLRVLPRRRAVRESRLGDLPGDSHVASMPGQFLECCMHVSQDMPVHSRPLKDPPAEHTLLSPAFFESIA